MSYHLSAFRISFTCFLFALLSESTIIVRDEDEIFENVSEINSSQSSNINLDPNLYQSDIHLSEEEEELLRLNLTIYYRNAAPDPKLLWPNGKVYYTIGSNYCPNGLALIRHAMAHIQTQTCVKFIDINTEEPPHGHSILIDNQRPGCTSHIGFRPNKKPQQLVNLGNDCVKDPAMSQSALLQVLGLHYEHSRPDRHYYITILWDNIVVGEKYKFAVNRGTPTFGLPYDFRSVLHFSDQTFSKGEGKPTMKAKWNPRMCLGNNKRATQCDLEKVRSLYKCPVRNNCAPRIKLAPVTGVCNSNDV